MVAALLAAQARTGSGRGGEQEAGGCRGRRGSSWGRGWGGVDACSVHGASAFRSVHRGMGRGSRVRQEVGRGARHRPAVRRRAWQLLSWASACRGEGEGDRGLSGVPPAGVVGVQKNLRPRGLSVCRCRHVSGRHFSVVVGVSSRSSMGPPARPPRPPPQEEGGPHPRRRLLAAPPDTFSSPGRTLLWSE